MPASSVSVPYLFAPSDFQYNQALNADLTSIGQRLGANVLDFNGIDPTGNNDSTSAIQSAINVNPGVVYLPFGKYSITSPLKIGNGTSTSVSTVGGPVLVGQGLPAFPGYGTSPTVISWVGAPNGIMVEINGPLSGWGVSNLELAGNSIPGVTGINVASAATGDSRNLIISRVYTGIYSLSYDLVGTLATLRGNVDAIHNTYTNLGIYLHDQAGGPKAIVLTGSGNTSVSSDTDYNDIRNCHVGFDGTANRMYGAYLQVCDSCFFHDFHVDGGNPNMVAVNFDYTVNGNFPNGCKFFSFDPGGANRCVAIGTANIGNNQIYALITGNGGNVQSLSGVTYV